MENLFLFLATTLLLKRSSPRPSFQRHLIGDTGCTACLLSHSPEFEALRTPTDDVMYINEIKDGEIVYGVIAVELFTPADSIEHAESILGQFMNSLHATFDIKHHTGLSYGYRQPASEYIRGIVDYWQDAEGIDWKVKGWTDGHVVSMLYVKNINELPVHRQDFFLDSFQFSNS